MSAPKYEQNPEHYSFKAFIDFDKKLINNKKPRK